MGLGNAGGGERRLRDAHKRHTASLFLLTAARGDSYFIWVVTRGAFYPPSSGENWHLYVI